MTTIVYNHDDHQVAVESRASGNDIILNDHADKVIVNGLGTWICCGSVHLIPFLVNCSMGDKQEDPDRDMNVAGLLIRDGKVYQTYFSDGYYCEDLVDFDFAMGSGMEFALTALDLGASATEAVECAIARDIFSGGEVHVINVADVIS